VPEGGRGIDRYRVHPLKFTFRPERAGGDWPSQCTFEVDGSGDLVRNMTKNGSTHHQSVAHLWEYCDFSLEERERAIVGFFACLSSNFSALAMAMSQSCRHLP
jgi:hypothetical protein